MISYLFNCRICTSNNLINVISLGEQIITSRFPIYGDLTTPKTPITLCMCQECGLIQLLETTNSYELYEYEYGYRSGISNTMREHLKLYQEEILSKVSLKDTDIIVDIGSNDSTMLQYYSSNLRRIGVDPTGSQFKEYYGDVELLPNYFNYENFTNTFGTEVRCKIVSSISMFYDLPDPVQFAKDIYSVLEQDGIWTCEQSYLLTMIKTNSVDTICHEHLEYYALKQVKEIADRANFKIIDVKFNDCNGGSFRVYFAKQESIIHNEATELINNILDEELKFGIMSINTYTNFMIGCDNEVKKLQDFINCINKNGQQMYIYGASTKGNCLLQYAKIDESMIKYAVERNPKKIGKMTSTGSMIISEETMRETPPQYLLVLPWHFRDEIIKREKTFLDAGGQLVFPFPHFEIVSSKPKLLITGSDGLIGHYIKQQCIQDYCLYGIVKTPKKDIENNISKFYFDITDSTKLEQILDIVRPDVIIHLASISSSQYAFKNPIETLNLNGMVIANLCEIIHRNNWITKLFNASSSEIYKGHVDYTVKENDTHMFHLHPYSIGKIMGTSIVDFYRTTYGLPFSNGVIFTTESPLKRPEFLLNRIASHARNWTNNKNPLIVGNLDSFRTILHASDVANAIKLITLQERGDSYLICSENSDKIFDLVIKLYSISNVKIEKRDNILWEKDTNLPVVIIDKTPVGVDIVPTNIRGEPTKLKKLGWKQTISLDNILNEMINNEFSTDLFDQHLDKSVRNYK